MRRVGEPGVKEWGALRCVCPTKAACPARKRVSVGSHRPFRRVGSTDMAAWNGCSSYHTPPYVWYRWQQLQPQSPWPGRRTLGAATKRMQERRAEVAAVTGVAHL